MPLFNQSFFSLKTFHVQELGKSWAGVDAKGREKYEKEAAKLKTKHRILEIYLKYEKEMTA